MNFQKLNGESIPNILLNVKGGCARITAVFNRIHIGVIFLICIYYIPVRLSKVFSNQTVVFSDVFSYLIDINENEMMVF